jgi:hypothetical protein
MPLSPARPARSVVRGCLVNSRIRRSGAVCAIGGKTNHPVALAYGIVSRMGWKWLAANTIHLGVTSSEGSVILSKISSNHLVELATRDSVVPC